MEKGTIMQFVRVRSGLPEAQMRDIAEERASEFRKVPGLIQKYYVKMGNEGEYGGVYIWDSIDSLKKFRGSELVATIPTAYQALEPPEVEVFEIMFELRP